MGIFNIKGATFRQLALALGVAGLVLSLVLLVRGHIVPGFMAAFLALSAIGVGETDLDVTSTLDSRSVGKLLRGRSPVSTLGKLCDIASYFCLAAAIISWIVLR
jgi:hypothetical protein